MWSQNLIPVSPSVNSVPRTTHEDVQDRTAIQHDAAPHYDATTTILVPFHDVPVVVSATRSNDIVERDDGSWITDIFLQEVLQTIHPGQEISVVNKDIQLAVGKGENYLSIIYRVEVQYKRGNTGNIENHHLILKGYPNCDFITKFITELGVFDRELSIYQSALTAIYTFAEERFQRDQIPYITSKSFKTSRPNTVVLEDLKYQGFRMANRKAMLDLQHCFTVVRNLAHLHGMSGALHNHNPDILSQYDNVVFGKRNKPYLDNFLPEQMRILSKAIKTWSGFETYAAKLEKLIPEYSDKLVDICTPQPGGFHVLTHGDCWINNYLFKYSSIGEPTDVRFVDFQLSCLGSPATDLTYFLYSSSQNEVRASRLDEVLKMYHTQLCETLAALGSNPEVFGFQDLKNEMKRVALCGLYAATTVLAGVVGDAEEKEEEAPDMAELTEERMSKEEKNPWEKHKNNPRFREALQQMLPHFDEIGVFD
ncbi:uncharacterized protein [Anabrus simplex]|uniref:uncharacterized protein n=1 Tax=Anabrus simplex TaxID=316456 RepID=UPI0035A399FC